MQIRLATATSVLATARAEQVGQQLSELGHDVELVRIGEANDPGPSSGVDLTTQLRNALHAGKCDVVVHAMEHVPVDPDPSLVIGAVLKRGDTHEALIARDGLTLETLPEGARIGTRAKWRIAQVRHIRPDLNFEPVDGQITERLRKVDDGEIDGIIFQYAGLETLGLEERATQVLDIIPAVGQSALGLECRAFHTEMLEALKQVEHHETRICVMTERAAMRELSSLKDVPVGALASRRGMLNIKAGAFSLDGKRRIVVELGLPTSELHAVLMGQQAAHALLERGAANLATQTA